MPHVMSHKMAERHVICMPDYLKKNTENNNNNNNNTYYLLLSTETTYEVEMRCA